MPIAVLSDIHSNFPALEKCVSYCLDRQIRTFLFLGDYLGDLAYPQKTMELCRQAEGECIWPWIPEKYWEEAVKQTFCLYTAV